MKQAVKEIVLDICDFDNEWPPDPLLEFQQWVNNLVEKIPEDRRSFATIEIDDEISYGPSDVSYAKMVVSYPRLETDEEERVREAYEHNRQVAKEEARRQDAHIVAAREIKWCNAEQKRQLLDLLKKECGE